MKELKENFIAAQIKFNNEVVKPWFRKTKRQLNKVRDRYPRQLIIVVMLVMIVVSVGIYYHTTKSALAVMVNGNEVGLVSSESIAKQAIEELKNKKSTALGGQVVQIADQITYTRTYGQRKELLSKGELEKLLEKQLRLVTTGAVVLINGEKRLAVANPTVGEQVLNRVKEYYASQIEGQEQLLAVTIEDKVEFKEETLAVNDILSPEQAVDLLINGADQTVKYKVKAGDSLWSIARAHGLLIKDLLDANPNLTEKLNIDQEISVVKVQPLLTVVTSVRGQGTEVIPYQVKVERDPNQWRGTETVKQAGTEGSKEVTYELVKRNGQTVERKIIEETIIKEPVDKVVVRGSKIMVASRGEDGGGKLGWPLRGNITSRYGFRGREFHPAIDIDGSTGDPILAAEGGKVTFAGWDGGYGRMVEISHGNGLTTRYAHCSAILVREGDEVSRGQIIAKVGSTGRSTGSHLHFEVRTYGVPRNPMNYLR
ncbi:MAG: peptidoglycan DD-metalloendopeptidase family protein [Firmicutes bacterium]|nr:peptidoglycan DD-metalloendopeptidase family protein [Bacillota bacterium]